MPKALSGYSRSRLPGRSKKEKDREEGEPDDGRNERKIGAKSPKKWLRASRRRRVRKKVPSRLHKEQSGKRLSKIGTARKSETRKRRKTGKRRTRWLYSAMRSKSWRRCWDEDGWKETLYS